MIYQDMHGKRNFSNVYLTFTGNVYRFILYNTIFFKKVNVTNVKYTTIHEIMHDLSRGRVS